VSFPSARNPALDPAPPPANLPALRVPWGQIAAIVVIATIVAWLGRSWPRVPWNAFIWLGSSITIALVANKGAARLFFTPFLALIFLVAIIGNEAVAHLVFGTCLYD
jgi:hypothetical protein